MADYEVGYGKPPRKHRFPKGKSGNPAGRPRKAKPTLVTDDAEILRRLDAEVIEFGGKEMSRREAEVRVIFRLAARGNKKARRLLDKLARTVPAKRRDGVVVLPYDEFKKLERR
jgi:hypothetical protein